MEKLLLSVDEAAERLSISRAHLYPRVMAGDVRSVTVGRARRNPVEALAEYVRRLEEEAAS